MAADGAFGETGPLETARIAYIGLGASPVVVAHDPTRDQIETLKAEFRQLLAHFLDPQTGFPSRRAVKTTRFTGDYDQLARYGEWDETETPPAPASRGSHAMTGTMDDATPRPGRGGGTPTSPHGSRPMPVAARRGF